MATVIEELAERIREIEQPFHHHSALQIPALAGLLGEDGLSSGSLVELLSSEEGVGTWTLGLLAARQAAGQQKALVIVDPAGCFYPPAAVAWGVDLRRTIVVRARKPREVYVASNLSLRCPAVGAVITWCDCLSSLEFRRLQLSAEAGAGLGVLLRSAAARRSPSFATLRLLVRPVPPNGLRPRLAIEVLRGRRYSPRGLSGRRQPADAGRSRSAIILEIDDETHDVRVPAELAAAAPRARSARDAP